ncbi:MAG: hypothetical protein JSS63_09460 [Bacteroidetes bacterium]|nr:hypothetical protein [Bacteroidota bacterium]
MFQDFVKQPVRYNSFIRNKSWSELKRHSLQDILKSFYYINLMQKDVKKFYMLRKVNSLNYNKCVKLIEQLFDKKNSEILKKIITKEEKNQKNREAILNFKSLRKKIDGNKIIKITQKVFSSDSLSQNLLYSINSQIHFAKNAFETLMKVSMTDSRKYFESSKFIITQKDFKLLVRNYRNFQAQLNYLQKEIYLNSIKDKTKVKYALQNLTHWVTQNFEELIKLNSFAQYLCSKQNKEDRSFYEKQKICISCSMLARETIASYISATIMLYEVLGVNLNRNTNEILNSALFIPFNGKIQIGKKSDFKRINRLPNNMLVSVFGILKSTDIVKKGRVLYYKGVLFDDKSKKTITIYTKSNFVEEGLTIGSLIRITGKLLKENTLNKTPCIEVEQLKIQEHYKDQFWKIAFLNNSSGYYNYWLQYLNIDFTYNPEDLSKNSVTAESQSNCDQEYLDYLNLCIEYDEAQEDFTISEAEVIGAQTAALISCVVGGVWTGGASCILATITLAIAIFHAEAEKKKVDKAKEKMDKARKKWQDCINPISGIGNIGIGNIGIGNIGVGKIGVDRTGSGNTGSGNTGNGNIGIGNTSISSIGRGTSIDGFANFSFNSFYSEDNSESVDNWNEDTSIDEGTSIPDNNTDEPSEEGSYIV